MKRVRGFGQVVSFALVMAGHAAVAQDSRSVGPVGSEPAAGPAHGLDEIVVTARRRGEAAQDVPIAITALDAVQLEARAMNDVRSLSKTTPSLLISQGGGNPSALAIALRGQIQNDSLITLDPSVGLYLDDQYIARSGGANMELLDLERVEVLAGPQGTLYGRNTTGGAIRLITRKADPSGELDGYAKVAVGNYEARRAEAAINLPIAADVFAVRIAALHSEQEGYTTTRVGTALYPYGPPPTFAPRPFTETRRLDTNDKDLTAARLSALLQVGDRVTFTLAGDWSDLDTNGALMYNRPAPQTAAAAVALRLNAPRCTDDHYESCLNTQPNFDSKNWGASLTGEFQFSDTVTLKAIYGHRDTDNTFTNDVDGTPVNFTQATLVQNTQQNSVEVQLLGNSLSNDLEWVTGVYWFKEKGDDFSYSQGASGVYRDIIPAPFGASLFLNRVLGGVGENESQSVFAQGTYALTDTLDLTLGARYTKDDRDFRGNAFYPAGPDLVLGAAVLGVLPGRCIYNNAFGPTRDNCFFDASDSFNHTSWTAGLDWKASDNVLLYVKSTNGYRAGGQNLRGMFPQDQLPFGPEEVTDVEIGIKSQLMDRRIRLNADYYHSFYKDIQSTSFTGSPDGSLTTVVKNQRKADIDGVEMQLTALVTDNFEVSLTGGWLDFQYKDRVTLPQLVPDWNASLNVQHTLEVGAGSIVTSLGYSYRDGYSNNASKAEVQSNPYASVSGVGLLDARMAYRAGQWEVALFGTNLTDKEYFVSPLVVTVPGIGNLANSTMVGAPRMWGVEARVGF